MVRSRLSDKALGWLAGRFASRHSTLSAARGPRDHVIILDGTLSSITPGEETNAGLTYRLLREQGGSVTVYYEAGLQWPDWGATVDVMLGRGINRQIRRAYGYLASHYRPGDRIFLMGYSRGAYAVRSLAGIIDRIGLIRRDAATESNIRQIYRLYQMDPGGTAARAFARLYCHPETMIEMVGVWDTVKALGLRVPLLWRMVQDGHAFHNHELGRSIRFGYHALALNERRRVYAPVLWQCPPGWTGTVEQLWFPGTHGDVGGQLGGFSAARGLSNLSLVWMLGKLEMRGLPLPEGWRARFPCDATAPSIGGWAGVGKLFLLRGARKVGLDPSEHLHESVQREEGREMDIAI
ncbi:hypothetical protein P775_20965 [Puniceibacterium antarcticum]|uniref:T6SS Phospholipase effector Tle1-like catalytic domain-containing protein n=1 Tax=Puniceibacterium antarcticum TaxID=1206336 RepID=A0A2G8R9J5_9RHOB|nr:DUF2235 domain-containing protein [Puniceibacterium antarcticum]PIL18230.1 hypothetical protein P775_20965 [Puniceibacterium antarcticum]